MASQERVDQLLDYVDDLIDMLANGELETSFDGETVKFVDSLEIGRRIKMLRREIDDMKASLVGARPRRIRAIRMRMSGDN